MYIVHETLLYVPCLWDVYICVLCVGGVFIVWDVMFRTFAREGDKIIYGLVHPVNTFNPIKLQVGDVALDGCGSGWVWFS